MKHTIHVNGTPRDIDVPAEMPLLWVLRDVLDLTGTKFGCGVAQCGACTVHLDGTATRACVLPVSAVGTRRVVTIEGLAGPAVDAVRASWIARDVPQCGYCQSGQIMSAVALLAQAKAKAPTDDDIDASMSGNLCRCGTYLRIRAAIHDAASTLHRRTSGTPYPPAG